MIGYFEQYFEKLKFENQHDVCFIRVFSKTPCLFDLLVYIMYKTSISLVGPPEDTSSNQRSILY